MVYNETKRGKIIDQQTYAYSAEQGMVRQRKRECSWIGGN
jgi:hypothetical protein